VRFRRASRAAAWRATVHRVLELLELDDGPRELLPRSSSSPDTITSYASSCKEWLASGIRTTSASGKIWLPRPVDPPPPQGALRRPLGLRSPQSHSGRSSPIRLTSAKLPARRTGPQGCRLGEGRQLARSRGRPRTGRLRSRSHLALSNRSISLCSDNDLPAPCCASTYRAFWRLRSAHGRPPPARSSAPAPQSALPGGRSRGRAHPGALR
jgi:hypothetical protein